MALLNSLTLGIAFLPTKGSKKLLTFLKNPQEEKELSVIFGENTIATLKKEGILVSESFDSKRYLRNLREKLLRGISVEMMYLLVTDYCNLKCTYCFEDTPLPKSDFRPTTMNREIADKAIDLFAKAVRGNKSPEKKKIIHLYGGEPLLNPDVVEFAIQKVHEAIEKGQLPNNTELAVVTNGLLLSEKLAKTFSENEVTVGLSIDGPQEINNRYRLSKKEGLNVFEEVMKAYSLLKKYRVKAGLSVTITPEAINHQDQLLEFFLSLAARFDDLDGLSLNLLHYNPAVSLPADHYIKAAEFQIKAFEIFREKGIYEERLMRKVQAFVNQEPIYADCGVVGTQLVIAPDGQIGICQDFVKPRTYFEGSVLDENPDLAISKTLEGWKKRSPFFMEQCLNCFAIGICGGGCPASAELKTGSRWNIDERICYHSRLTLEWLIWDAYNQMALGK